MVRRRVIENVHDMVTKDLGNRKQYKSQSSTSETLQKTPSESRRVHVVTPINCYARYISPLFSIIASSILNIARIISSHRLHGPIHDQQLPPTAISIKAEPTPTPSNPKTPPFTPSANLRFSTQALYMVQ